MIWLWRGAEKFTGLGDACRASFGNLTGPNREVITAFGDFDRITSLATFSDIPPRVQGEYRLRTAKVHLTLRPSSNHGRYEYLMELEGVNLDDLVGLYTLIRAGKIWPEVSFEEAQVPPPARHLRQLLREAWAIICREVSAKFRRLGPRAA